jgi:hypothetical protein
MRLPVEPARAESRHGGRQGVPEPVEQVVDDRRGVESQRHLRVLPEVDWAAGVGREHAERASLREQATHRACRPARPRHEMLGRGLRRRNLVREIQVAAP